ncbi:hypothetical protein ACRN9C_05720 [Shewanella frigidimarina]|jgi:hypothetical protein|uniref:hypothetical protein n=1 Tax=Shewanella frigidimarina TaxID=56812 RepID=UPI003D7A811E
MNFYEQSSGRGLEIFIGLIVLLIALIFAALIGLIVSNASFGYSSVLGSLALALCSYWFVKLSYRLVFNKPRSGGGLFSPNVLKTGCVLLGVSSILLGLFSISQNDIGSLLGALGMLIACLYGWKIANKRKDNET